MACDPEAWKKWPRCEHCNKPIQKGMNQEHSVVCRVQDGGCTEFGCGGTVVDEGKCFRHWGGVVNGEGS